MKAIKKFIVLTVAACVLSGCSGSNLSSSEKAKIARIEAIRDEMNYTLENPERYVQAVSILLTGADSLDKMHENLGELESLITPELVSYYSVSRAPEGVLDSPDPVMSDEEQEEYKKWLEEYLNNGQNVESSNGSVEDELSTMDGESDSDNKETNTDGVDLSSESSEEQTSEGNEDNQGDVENETESDEETSEEPEGDIDVEARDIGYVAMSSSGGNGYVYDPNEVIVYDIDETEESGISDDEYYRQMLDLDITITEYQVYYKMIIMTRLTNSGPVYYKVDLDDNNVIVNISSFS